MKNLQPNVYVVVLNWNGCADTIKCAESLAQLNYYNLNVLIIDNGSTDDSVQRIHAAVPQFEVIENKQNLGFSAGCNVGIRQALQSGTAEYIWLVNNDAVVSPDALIEMVELGESDRSIGGVGSVIYDMKDPEQILAWGGGQINLWTGRSRHLKAPGEVDYITGASMLLRVRALKQTGLLDESFFLYWEDSDLSLRLKGAGYYIAVANKSIIYHNESTTVGKGSLQHDFMFNEATVRFCRKHSFAPVISIFIAITGRCVKRLLAGRVASIVAVLKGSRRGWIE